jgi:hypothetical protein
MGSYITAAEVVVFTNSKVSTADINAIIDDAEDEVDDEVVARGGSADTTSKLLKAAVKFTVMAALLERGIFDGTYVDSIGGITFKNLMSSGMKVEDLRDMAQKKIDLFLTKSGGIWDTSDTAIDETIVREDHEMPDGNLDQSKIKEYHDKATDTGNEDTDNGDTD